MQARKLSCLVLLLFVTGCAQIRAVFLPEGIILLKEIDRVGLHSPIWSPDGNQIVASYTIYPMPDIMGFFGPESRYDLVMIDTNTWKSTIIASQESGDFSPQAWIPDGKSFVVDWSDGYGKNGMYLFNIDGTKSTSLSEYGALSPDLSKLANFDDPYVRITDIHTRKAIEFTVPATGSWYINSWSPDMKQLTLVYEENEKARFQNIYLLELDSGSFYKFTNESSFYKYSPTFSPNGQFLAYIMHRFAENKIETKLIVSRLDQSCEWTVPLDNVDYFTWSPDSQRMFISGTDGVYVADLNVLFGNDFSIGKNCS
jgi:hypothetical protein